MNGVCTTCGLVNELCVCETIAKESQKIKVYIMKKRFNKVYTIVEGIDQKEINLKDIGRVLKSELACGGTIKEGRVELQGSHCQKVKAILVKYGFSPNTIEVQQ